MEGYNKLALLRAFAPKFPGILGAGAMHSLGISETSSKWDLKSTLIISTIRSFLDGPISSSVSQVQRLSTRDPGIKGPLWVSKQRIPASSEDASEVLHYITKAIGGLGKVDISEKFTIPEIQSIDVEWTGWRSNASKNEPRLSLAENLQYERLMADVKSDVTILYVHGGAFYLMDPASHRVTVARLAKHTGGRCMSVRYRLAPQHPFPTALLDCFIAYLSLISPPSGSVHEAVPASKVVFAGDSAGGNLCLALLQLILELHRQNNGKSPTVKFHGKDVPILMPAGLAMQSPWVDLTRSLPSVYLNSKWDYLPIPTPDTQSVHKPDAVWPSRPPRADMYCEGVMMIHPLVSPLMAKDWSGSPPVFFCIGQESLADENMVLARHLAESEVKVEFWQFEAMPHVFPAVFADLPGANLAMKKWANAVSRMAIGDQLETVGILVKARSLVEKRMEVTGMASYLADEDVERKLKDACAKRETKEYRQNRVSSRL